ncbi:MAG: hypothetical protein WAW75_05035 [Gallionella sp.]
MSLNAQAIAVSGYGYGAQLMAVSGYGAYDVAVPPVVPPVVTPSTQVGGIVKYVQHADRDNRTALMQYQRKRLEQQIEDEEILAIIIAISQRTLH